MKIPTLTCIGATSCPVTAGVLVGGDVVARVDGHAHGLVIPFKRVVLRAPVAIDKVGITVVEAPFGGVGRAVLVTRHVDPVHGGVTLAPHVAHVDVVGPDVVRQVGLPVHERVRADVGS